jgi:hypothetical protein
MTPSHCGNSTTWFKGNERVEKNGKKKKKKCLSTLNESENGHGYYNYEKNCDS